MGVTAVSNILFGNMLSLVGAIFLSSSCIAKTKKGVVILQLFQCIFMATAQIVFGKGAGAVSMSVAGIRNILIYFDRFGAFMTVLLSAITLALGIYLNSGGIIGLIPTAVGVLYTFGLYAVKDVYRVKIVLCVLLYGWIVYSALIFDVFGMLSNMLAQVLNVITLKKMRKPRA